MRPTSTSADAAPLACSASLCHHPMMEWQADGIVIGCRRHGESAVILEVMTRERGRHLGLVRGGRSRRMQPVLQPGNTVQVQWQARLEEHLGLFKVEPVALRAARFMGSSASLFGLTHLAGLLRLLAEREAHPGLHDACLIILEHLDAPGVAAPLIARFELEILSELGFGVDLTSCAVTGSTQNLVYVSPKSARAVSGEAGEAYKDRLLPLPAFLRGLGLESREALRQGFALSGYFLNRHVYEPRGLQAPAEREMFVAQVTTAE
jgi:DNA repair protein RecO (recombination protein O)